MRVERITNTLADADARDELVCARELIKWVEINAHYR